MMVRQGLRHGYRQRLTLAPRSLTRCQFFFVTRSYAGREDEEDWIAFGVSRDATVIVVISLLGVGFVASLSHPENLAHHRTLKTFTKLCDKTRQRNGRL
jgi:hypothetical protein